MSGRPFSAIAVEIGSDGRGCLSWYARVFMPQLGMSFRSEVDEDT